MFYLLDLVNPDNIPDAKAGNGLGINFTDFAIGAIFGSIITLIITISIFFIIKTYRSEKEETNQNNLLSKSTDEEEPK